MKHILSNQNFGLNPLIGWNIAPGGHGGYRPCTTETRLKLSISQSGANNHYYGKTHSLEIRQNISNLLMSKPEQWRKQNASNAGKKLKGHKRSQCTRDKQKDISLNRPKYTCAYCGKTGQYNSMIAYHGDNCKKKIK